MARTCEVRSVAVGALVTRLTTWTPAPRAALAAASQPMVPKALLTQIRPIVLALNRLMANDVTTDAWLAFRGRSEKASLGNGMVLKASPAVASTMVGTPDVAIFWASG